MLFREGMGLRGYGGVSGTEGLGIRLLLENALEERLGGDYFY